jgi:hypothetical protein
MKMKCGLTTRLEKLQSDLVTIEDSIKAKELQLTMV